MEKLQEIPSVFDTENSITFPDIDEYTYWEARESRIFYVDWEIDEEYFALELSKVIIQMNFKEMSIPKEQLKPIYIFIHSYGGDLEQAYGLIDVLLSSRIPIITITMGAAMSAGCLIFLAGHKRYSFEHSNLMIHKGNGQISGTADQIEQAQKNYKKNLDNMKEFVLSRTNLSEKIFNRNKNKDWYFTSEELIEYGIVDKIINDFEDIFKTESDSQYSKVAESASDQLLMPC